jgi:hypothetical protein
MLLRQKIISEWVTAVPLTNAETRVVEVGNVLSGQRYIDMRSHDFLTFSLNASHTCRIEIQGDFEPGFGTVDTCYTINVPAATLWTPYNMGAPWNQTGYLVLVKPITRIRLIDTAAADHTHTRFYAKAWG